MANIRFASKGVFDLYLEMRDKTSGLGRHSLESCMARLLGWGPADTTITVYRDTCDKMSFYFVQKWDDREVNPEHEKMLMNGGIVLHGERDGFGSGDGPTFSVSMDKSEGYQIHT